jgi:hypothetical protein
MGASKDLAPVDLSQALDTPPALLARPPDELTI